MSRFHSRGLSLVVRTISKYQAIACQTGVLEVGVLSVGSARDFRHRLAETRANALRTNVPPRTLYRWLKEPCFEAAYRKAKRTAFGQAVARLHQGTSAAAATMLKIMVDPSVPPATRLRAADCVFTHAENAIEIEEIE